MYWLLDVGVIALLVAAIADGYRRGIIRMLLGLGAFFLRIIYTLLIAVVVLFIAQMVGALDALTLALTKALGESSFYSTEMFANFIAAAIFAVVGIVIGVVTLFFIVRACRRAAAKSKKPFIFNRLLGVIVWIVIFVALLLVILGFLRALANAGGLLSVDEVIRACPITGWVYKINPLTSIIEKTKIPYYIIKYASGKF